MQFCWSGGERSPIDGEFFLFLRRLLTKMAVYHSELTALRFPNGAKQATDDLHIVIQFTNFCRHICCLWIFDSVRRIGGIFFIFFASGVVYWTTNGARNIFFQLLLNHICKHQNFVFKEFLLLLENFLLKMIYFAQTRFGRLLFLLRSFFSCFKL